MGGGNSQDSLLDSDGDTTSGINNRIGNSANSGNRSGGYTASASSIASSGDDTALIGTNDQGSVTDASGGLVSTEDEMAGGSSSPGMDQGSADSMVTHPSLTNTFKIWTGRNKIPLVEALNDQDITTCFSLFTNDIKDHVSKTQLSNLLH